MTGRGGAREEEKKRKACGGKKGRAMQGREGKCTKANTGRAPRKGDKESAR